MNEKSEIVDVKFKVCEFEGGIPFICTLENGPLNNLILHGELSQYLILREGTSWQDAENLVRLLNEHVAKSAVTIHENHPALRRLLQTS